MMDTIYTYSTSHVNLISYPILKILDGASSILSEKAISLLDISPPKATSFERAKRSMIDMCLFKDLWVRDVRWSNKAFKQWKGEW